MLRYHLESNGYIVGVSPTGDSLISEVLRFSPDVIVLDISLPGISGIETIRRIVIANRDVKVLVFSMHEEIVFVERSIQAGAIGYITKSSD